MPKVYHEEHVAAEIADAMTRHKKTPYRVVPRFGGYVVESDKTVTLVTAPTAADQLAALSALAGHAAMAAKAMNKLGDKVDASIIKSFKPGVLVDIAVPYISQSPEFWCVLAPGSLLSKKRYLAKGNVIGATLEKNVVTDTMMLKGKVKYSLLLKNKMLDIVVKKP
jgi:hypothetical protein